MNSVAKHLTAPTKAATLLAMRSAKKEIIFVVEGDTEVDLFANVMELPRSNILSCDGKEILMELYEKPRDKGVDSGTIFLRDRDFDGVISKVDDGVAIFVTGRYDIEVELFENRIFHRVFQQYIKKPVDFIQANISFLEICKAASYVGILRKFSKINSVNLDFDDLKYNKFMDNTLSIDIDKMINYIFAKSRKELTDFNKVKNFIIDEMKCGNHENFVCSKEFIEIFGIALARKYKACDAGKSCPEIIENMLRVSVSMEDIKKLSYFPSLREYINGSSFSWVGLSL